MTKCIYLLLAILVAPIARGEMTLLVGSEDLAREPPGNQSQTWTGIELSTSRTLVGPFSPFTQFMVGMKIKREILFTVGLSYTFHPIKSVEQLAIRIQTGPAYTDVGKPHTGSELNWTSELRVVYRGFLLGYTHTSNAHIRRPNSGLDILLVGYSFTFGPD